MIHVHLGVNVVNFHNEEVEINSLDQHPTESGHQEILHQSCYCNTGSLWKERVFVYLWRSFRQDIYGATGKFVPWIEKGATNFVFCGVYSGEEDDLSSSKWHRNTQSNLRERLTNISNEIIVKKRRRNNELYKSNNDNNINTLKAWVGQTWGHVAWVCELSDITVLVCMEIGIEISFLTSLVEES